MQTLSQKKKIGIIAGAILLLTVVTLVSTGRMSLSGLSSSAITSPTYVCSEQNQARNLAQYNQIPNNITNANNKISIISGEIKVLQDKINAHNTTIAQKQAQITTRPAEIARLNGLIAPLTTFINTKCSKPTGSMVRTCNDKKKEKLKYGNEITKLNNLENDITKLRNEIGTPENSKSLKGKIQLKENQIGIWQGKIAGYELSKKQYERCALELKTKPTVFSGAMSGEIKLISGEIQPGTEKLVSGEVMFFTGTVIAPHISGEVTISGEVGQSPILTVVANKMEFSVKPTPENNFNIKNWFLEFDQYARATCTSKQVSSNPVEIKVTCNLPAKNTPPIIISAGTVGNFKLIGKLGSITMPLAVETNFVSLQYNGSRADIDKQTAPSNLRYEKSPVTDVYFRFASWTCHNGEIQNEGSTGSCKPQSLWKQYAETFCQNKCSPETGKCGVNSYSNSEQCIDKNPSVCGNGIKEGVEQCDDGNTNNTDSCNNLCQTGTTGGGGGYTVSCASIPEAAGNSCNNCRRFTLNSTHLPSDIFTPRSGIPAGNYEYINTVQSPITGVAYQGANVSPIGNVTNLFNLTERGVGNNSWVWATMKSGNSITKGPIPGNINIDRPIYLLKYSTVSAFKNAENVVQPGTDVTKNDCFFYYEPPTTTPSCTDSDGGLDFLTRGITEFPNTSWSDQCVTQDSRGNTTNVDTCSGDTCFVTEFYCQKDREYIKDGTISYINQKCTNGCSDGACLHETTQKLSGFDVRVNGYIVIPQLVKINTPLDMTIRAVDNAGNNVTKYDGTVLFEVIHPAGEPLDKSDIVIPQLADGKYGYQFTSSDQGSHTFKGGFTFKKSGIYSFIFKDPATQTDTNVVYRSFWITVIDTDPPVYTCTDSDGATNYNVKGTIQQKVDGAPVTLEHSDDYCEQRCDPFNLSPMGVNCADTGSVVELSCRPDGSGLIDATAQPCPNGCSNGACKPADPVVEACEDLAITPSTIQGGGTVNYTCQSSNDILCVLDPQYCTPKTYSVVVKKPDGGITQTSTTATGSITIPSSPAGTYTAECFVNGQTTTIAACKKTITNNTPAATLNVTGLNTQLSTPAKYIISPNGIGATDAMKAVFNVTSTGGTSTITELTFTMSGGDSNAVTMVKVGNVSSAVVNNVATLYGLNIPISEGSTQQITAQLSYSGVGEGGIKTGTNSGTTLSQVKYSAGSSISTITPNVSSKVMILTGSIPYVSTPGPSFTQFGLVLGSQNKIGEVTIAADAKGSIRINTIGFVSEYFGPDNSISLPIRITDGTNTITGSNCYFEVGGATGVGYGSKIIVCDLGTNNKLDHDGYEIPAGASKTFSLYTTINGNTIQTKVDETIFNWEDTTYSGTEGSYANGWLLPNFPSQNQYNRAT